MARANQLAGLATDILAHKILRQGDVTVETKGGTIGSAFLIDNALTHDRHGVAGHSCQQDVTMHVAAQFPLRHQFIHIRRRTPDPEGIGRLHGAPDEGASDVGSPGQAVVER